VEAPVQNPVRARSPWAFVPILYFLQGIPYMLVQTVPGAFLTLMKVPVETIGHWTGLLGLPWTLKPLWSPVVDLVGRKRVWILATQILIVVGIAALSFAVTSSHFLTWTLIACAWIAFGSATHDIAADGFYLLALDRPQQAAFVGIRSASFRLAMIFVTGGIVYLAGWFEAGGDPVPRAWSRALVAAAIAYAVALICNAFLMPRPGSDGPVRRADKPPVVEALSTYFGQRRIVAVVAFILLYRFGESMLTAMARPFLLKPAAEGGMGLTARQFGVLYGTIGVLSLLVGGILGGIWISKRGLKRCLWPMVIAMHAPNLLFLWAAIAHPGKAFLATVIAVEQLGYGFGFAAYTVYLMQVSQGGRFATTHYAISTGLMGLAAMGAAYISGDIVAKLGFPWFFGIVCLASIPGMFTILFIPVKDEPAKIA